MLTETERLAKEYVALEHLLWLASFYEGPLDARILTLPLPQFAYATRLMYALGWVDS